MNERLQKKCVIAATGLHLLLLLILVVGPAFFSPANKQDNMPVLDIIPLNLKTVDELVNPSGGNPNAGRQASVQQNSITPPQPQDRQVTKPIEPADPPKPPPKPPVNDNTEPSDKPQSHKVQVNLKQVDRSKVRPTNSTITSATEKAQAEERKKAAEAFANAASSIRSGTSKSTEIEMPGYGGGGVPYANFLQAVKSIYANAWTVPDGVTDDEAAATASVTIARDGTIVSTRIIKSSGNSKVDQSVQSVLDRIRTAVPLPDSAKENERTVTIKFNVKAKLLG